MSKFNLRQRPRISYYEPEEPNLDEYIFCEQCADYVYEYCSIHGPLLVVPDDKVPAKPKVPSFVPRAALTIPKVFLHLNRSVIPGAGLGVFTTLTLPCGVRFGPYKGEKTTEINSAYCWQIYNNKNKPSHVIDAADPNKSNWMRYVNCARHWCEQNLVAFQYQGQLYYRTIKIIPRFTELMVFYGSEFANSLRVDLRRYNAPSEYAQKFGAPIKKPKADSRKQKNNSEASNEDSVVNSDANIPNSNANIPELSKKSEHLEGTKGPDTTNDKNNNLTETSKAKFVCNECGQQFYEKKSIILHMKTKHLKEVYLRCIKCSYYTTIKQRFGKHLKLHDESRQHVCQCGFRFKSKSNLKLHKESCNIKNNVSSANSTVISFSCIECTKKYTSKKSLIIHMRTHTGEKPYSCTVCNKQFNRSDKLIIHMRTHTGEKPYSCTVCNKQFSQSNNLIIHMRTHTGEKPFSCTVCNKQFSLSNNLISHMRTHTGEKPYSCTVCNKQFTHSNTLISHMRTHTGEKPYSCTVCNKQFTHSNTLISHMRTHTGEKPYSCTVCNKQFSLSNNLIIHMRTHTGEKPYSCTVCNKQFSQSNTLISHMRTHTGEKPYSCTVCKKRFANGSTLRRHSIKCK